MYTALPAVVGIAAAIAGGISVLGATAIETRSVAIKFEARVGDERFACGMSYDGIGTSRSKITPTDFRFYVSDVQLIDATGQAVPIALDQDGVWQYKSVALMDFEDGTGPCRNGNAGLHNRLTGIVPKGDYRAIRFTLGVPAELNHGDPTVAPSPLNLTSMFWNWRAGYKFVKVDMATRGQPQRAASENDPPLPSGKKPRGMSGGYPVHLGSTGCVADTATTPAKSCAEPNRVDVTLSGFDPDRNTIVADLASLLRNNDVDVNLAKSGSGCMSTPANANCWPIFAAFGLPADDRPATTQQFFSTR